MLLLLLRIFAHESALTTRISALALDFLAALSEPGKVLFALVHRPATFQIAKMEQVMNLFLLGGSVGEQFHGLLHHVRSFEVNQELREFPVQGLAGCGIKGTEPFCDETGDFRRGGAHASTCDLGIAEQFEQLRLT